LISLLIRFMVKSPKKMLFIHENNNKETSGV